MTRVHRRNEAHRERGKRVCRIDVAGLVRTGRGRIVLVDAFDDWAKMFAQALRDLGYEVNVFVRAADVVRSPALHLADAVVIGSALPKDDGASLCHAIHEEYPALPVVLCTAQRRLEVALEAMRAGFVDCLVQPITPCVVDACIRRVLEQARARSRRRASRVQLLPGLTVPGTSYRIDAWIGEGGMGAVFAATHLGIDRKVALKVLHAELCADERAVTMLRNEARASAHIDSAHVVEVLDLIELADGRLMIAMEYLDGIPLDQLIDRAPLRLDRLFPIARQLCKALSAAHAAGIIHRDIKPENVMLVRERGKHDVVRLVDFGVAAFEAHETACWAGTPSYMAPEAAAQAPIDRRVDQYALGCLLYEWVFGRLPFDGERDEILRAQMYDAPAFPTEREAPGVPLPLRRVILRCLAKNPNDRFANMDELEAALCEAQIALGVTTAHDDLPLPEIGGRRRDALAARMSSCAVPRSASLGRRWRTWAASAATLVALTGLGMASPESPPEPARKRVEVAAKSPAPEPAAPPPPIEPRAATVQLLPASLAIAATNAMLAADPPALAERATPERATPEASDTRDLQAARERAREPAREGAREPAALHDARVAVRHRGTADGWLRLGDGYFDVGRYQDAYRAYEQARRLGAREAGTRAAKAHRRLRGH